MRVLIVEDDPRIANRTSTVFVEAGHHVDRVADGRSGLELASSGEYDVLVVDRKLPRLDGLDLVRALRASKRSVPILVISALNAVEDRIAGFEAGADDYLGKPFPAPEILARVIALRRRPPGTSDARTLRVADLELDLADRVARRADVPVALTPRELAILEWLMRYAGRPVTRSMLLEGVWGYGFDPHGRLVESHVDRLRAKIDPSGSRALLHALGNLGYILREPC